MIDMGRSIGIMAGDKQSEAQHGKDARRYRYRSRLGDLTQTRHAHTPILFSGLSVE